MRSTFTFLLGLGCWLAAHLTTQAQSLQLLSTTTPASPQGPLDAVAVPSRLYVADFSESALRIYDTTQPTALKLLGSLTGILRPRRLVVNGTKVYLSSLGIGSSSDSWLYAVDVSNAAAPSVIRRATLLPAVAQLAASSTLLCAAISPVVYVFDSNLNPLSTITAAGLGLALHDTYLYVLESTRLLVYDLRVPTSPVLLNQVDLGSSVRTSGFTAPLAIANNHLYISGYTGIFTLSNPALPTLASPNSLTFNSTSGTRAYQLTSNSSIVSVVDLRVPTVPVVAATAAGFTSPPYLPAYSPTDVVTGVDDLVYALLSSSGQIKTYRYTAGVLATRSSAQPAFTLYPNPAANEVTLELPTPAAAGQRVILRNACGQLVLEQALAAGSTRATLSLAALQAGLYVVQSGTTSQKLLRQ